MHPFAGAAYSISKAAAAALTREMAADFGPWGVRVNAIAPGEIDTAILSPGTEKIVETIPLRRLGQPAEVAKAIYYLCTDQSVLRHRRGIDDQWRPARLTRCNKTVIEPLYQQNMLERCAGLVFGFLFRGARGGRVARRDPGGHLAPGP